MVAPRLSDVPIRGVFVYLMPTSVSCYNNSKFPNFFLFCTFFLQLIQKCSGMGKLLFGLCVLLLVYSPVSAQNVQQRGVPAVVLNAFQQQFPNARQVDWEKKRNGNYEVEFDNGWFSRDHLAIISPEGKVLRYEEELASYSLPDAVKQKIKVEFDGYRVGDVKKVETGGLTTYAVELESRRGDLEVLFATDGKIMKERMD